MNIYALATNSSDDELIYIYKIDRCEYGNIVWAPSYDGEEETCKTLQQMRKIWSNLYKEVGKPETKKEVVLAAIKLARAANVPYLGRRDSRLIPFKERHLK